MRPPMKKTTKGAIALGLSAIATFTSAHSMTPSEIKEYVTKPVNKFTVTLTNRYPKTVCYTATQDGSLIMMAPICLGVGESRNIDYYVKSEPDKQTNTQVCTSPNLSGNIEVNLCTVIKTFFPHSRLR